MKIGILMASAASLALAACGGGNEEVADANLANDGMAMEADANLGMDANASVDAAVPASGQEYADMAAAGDMYEIESSKLAIEKSKNADVKSLAQMIVKDHEKSTADLKAAAAKAEPAITVAPKLTAEQESNLAALRAASDADFDRTYLAQQVPAHEKTLAMVQGYSAGGDVASLKEHAAAVAGPVQQHLTRARELAAKPAQ